MVEDYNNWKQKKQDEEEGWNSTAAEDNGLQLAIVGQMPPNVVEQLAVMERRIQVLQDRNEELTRELDRQRTQLQVGFTDLNARVSALETHVFQLNWGIQ